MPALRSPEVEESAERVGAAIADLAFDDEATVILISPHGGDARVSNRADGNLEALGVPEVEVDARVDEDFVAQLADRWVWPSSSEDVDHGIAVPIALGATKGNRVVPVSLPEVTGTSPHGLGRALEEARALARAVSEIAAAENVVVVASVNTSAGLSARAPLGDSLGAARIEARVLSALQEDLSRIEGLVEELHSTGGSCGAAPLLCMSLLFGGRPAGLLAYGSPVGVGYPVAQVVL